MVFHLLCFSGWASVTKEIVIAYKQTLLAQNYAVRSINSMLASLNSLFAFLGWNDFRVKPLKFAFIELHEKTFS